jgi:UDP-N-acetylmuramate dehydrogenase
VPLYLPQFNLQKFNTLAVPAVADFFVSVSTEAELWDALKFARERNLPMLLLGGGSNIVLQHNFPGLVVHIRLMGKELIGEDNDFYYVRAAAGENWHELVEYCLDNHYWGLENLSLIPGSVGAAPIQNIGAYGVELKDVISELTALDIKSGLSVTFPKDACQFGYRDSIFKQALLDKYVITSVTLQLRKQPRLILEYPALKQALANCDHPVTPADVSEIVCNIRRSKLPDPQKIPNVGSFFKNPIVSERKLAELKDAFPDLVFYPAGDGEFKLAAGWLIEKAGWKGFEGEACVHSSQALVLTNPHHRPGTDVLALAERIRQSVAKLFGVGLEQEPRNYP